MTLPKPDVVLVGQVVVAADARGLETAEALAIGGGRVLAVGGRREIVEAAGSARVVRTDDAAIVPGLHDFHLHLVGMARARRIVDLSGARTMDEVVGRLVPAAARLAAGEWLRGDGWSAEALDRRQLHRLEDLVAGRPALLRSHDHHSAWASLAAREIAGVGDTTPDPAGGRIDRAPDGAPDGVLRERAVDLVAERAPRMSGDALAVALIEVAQELLALGVTGATDAGDSSAPAGHGRYAELGDSFSSLAEAGGVLDRRLRLNVDLPAAGLAAVTRLGLKSGSPVSEDGLLRLGWAKVYADGALGSRTAALFDRYRCEGASDGGETGILRVSTDELDALLGEAAAAGIGLAIHAIGDRAVSTVLDAISRRKRDAARIPHRIEHAQLVRTADRPRFAQLAVTASLQPIHLPGDRTTAEECWADRLAEAYPWRSLASAGALLAFGSDAPIESANPWLGIHAAVHRCLPGDSPPDWGAGEILDLPSALGAYTLGPARATRRSDLGHLRPGARADLAVLNVDLRTLLTADERLASVRSRLTLVDGREVHAE